MAAEGREAAGGSLMKVHCRRRSMAAGRWLAIVVAMAVVAAGCGSRLSRDEILSAEQGRSVVVEGSTDVAPGAAVDPLTGETAVAAPGASEGVSPGATVPPAAASSDVPSGGAAPSDDAAAEGAQQPAPGNAPATAAAGCPEQLAPIRLGHIGTYSGAPASSYKGGDVMAKVWERSVNERGGVACHPIEVVTANDDGNPARTRSIARDMVENKKVIAFLNPMLPLSLSGLRPYVEERGIPVIGGDGSVADWWESPVMFPHITYVDDSYLAGVRAAKASNRGKISVMYCAESASCTSARDIVTNPKYKRDIGHTVVHEAQVTLTQPDYTAECLSARNAGAQTIWLALDASSISRVARSCASQGYKVLYTTESKAIANALTKDPNIEEMVFGAGAFPFTANDFPAAQEFQAAVKKYAPDLALSGIHSMVWSAGKLFEAAGKNLPANPTSADVMAAMRTVNKETLGGLTVPLNFTGKLPSRSTCYFDMALKKGKFVTPKGTKMQCP